MSRIDQDDFPLFIRLCAVGCLLMLSACQGKQTSKKSVPSKTLAAQREQVLVCEAKRDDVPLPVGYTFYEAHGWQENWDVVTAPYSYELSYVGNLSLEQVADFYRNHMERLGWQLNDFSNEHEALVVCTKPHRSCAVSIRPHAKNSAQTVIHFFHQELEQGQKQAFADINCKNLEVT